MAAGNWFVYNEAKKYMLTADLDLDAALMRIKLVKGTAAANVSDFTRSKFASITGAPSNLKAPHPKSLTGLLITAGASAKAIKFDATDPIFTASGGNATSVQYAVIGISGGKALAWCKLSTAAFPITSGNTLTLVLGVWVNYQLSARWVFAYRFVSHRGAEFRLFLLVGVITLLVSLGLMALLVGGMGLHYMLAKCVTAAFTLVANFIGRRLLLFTDWYAGLDDGKPLQNPPR